MTSAPRLAVRRLGLKDFRCYGQLRLETDPRPVVLTGANGAGKTNILEALSTLVPGRGLRRAPLGDLLRHGATPGAGWAVSALLEDGSEVGTGKGPGAERRAVRVDGETVRPAQLAERLSALWLTPVMDRLFTEGASGRRRFLDRLVFGLSPGHAREVSAYEHAMKERTRLLKDRRDGHSVDPAWVTALEDGMARHGVAVAAARVETATALDQACRAGIGPFPAARLEVDGEVEQGMREGMTRDEAEDRLRSAYARVRARDEAAGTATLGPHRSDLRVRHAAKDLPVGQCSTGEQKAVLVAIVLAQGRVQRARRGRAPLLLLDEVVAHLDDIRRAALFDELCAMEAQSWLTGTDAVLFEGFGQRAQFFRVAEATVTFERG